MAHLSRCDLLAEAWMADRDTQARRQQVVYGFRSPHRAALKNPSSCVLHQHN